MLYFADNGCRVKGPRRLQRLRVELTSGPAAYAGSIARAALAKWAADIGVLASEQPGDEAEFLSEDLLVYRV